MKIEGLEVIEFNVGGIQRIAKYGRKYNLFRPLKNIVYNFMKNIAIYDNLKGIVKFIEKIDLNAKTDRKKKSFENWERTYE